MSEIREFSGVDDILDFAIDREQQAADFYNGLVGTMEKEWMKKTFAQFAKEEMGHKAKLQAVKKGQKLVPAKEKVLDLKIGDYLVDVEASDDMGYQQVLVLAMKREKKAFKLYHDLADRVDDEDVRQLFLGLAQEEAKHKLRFEIEYDDMVLRDN
jgi:rubrerythrin